MNNKPQINKRRLVGGNNLADFLCSRLVLPKLLWQRQASMKIQLFMWSYSFI